MKVYPVMLLKTNGESISDNRHPLMLMKIKDLWSGCHDVDDDKGGY
jgi:hypothetical protein